MAAMSAPAVPRQVPRQLWRLMASGDNRHSEHNVASAGHVEQLLFSSQRKWEESFRGLTVGCVES